MLRPHPLRQLLPYFRPYLKTMLLGWTLVVASNLLVFQGPKYLGQGVDAIADGDPFSAVMRAVFLMMVVALAGGVLRFGMRMTLNSASRWVEYDLRNSLYQHLQKLPVEFYQRSPTGDLIALSSNDLLAVRMLAGPAIMYLVDTLTRTAIALPFMIVIDWRLTLIALGPMAALPIMMHYFGQAIHQRFGAVR